MNNISLHSVLIDTALIVIGLVLLYFGAGLLVKSAAQIGKKMRLSPLVIGVTIVAFGTSAPELAVTIDAAITNNPDLALANIVGSNLANIGLVAGMIALIGGIKGIQYSKTLISKDMRFMLAAAVVLFIFLIDIELSRVEGGLLLLGLLSYVGYRLLHKDEIDEELEEDLAAPDEALWKCLTWSFVGLLMLAFGGDTLVSGASALALDIGVPQAVIGFTVVAIGSSLPEIATSLFAVRAGKGGIAIGNIVGSNIWNIFGVLGLSALLIPINGEALPLHMTVAMVVSGFVLWLMLKLGRKLIWIHGCILILGYLTYQSIYL